MADRDMADTNHAQTGQADMSQAHLKHDALPVSLRERHKQRVMQQIIAAAEALFRAQGFDRTTMDEIAEKAEISRATLFNYFPSKEALLLPWGREIMEQQILPPRRRLSGDAAARHGRHSHAFRPDERGHPHLPRCRAGACP